MKIYCRGKILPESEAVISANDAGFLYGASLFETFRTYRGDPLLLEEHMARLAAGCRAFGIEPGKGLLISRPPAFEALRKTIRALLSENRLQDAVFRYTLSAGESSPGLPACDYRYPAETLHVRPLPTPRKTIRLHLLTTRRSEPEVFPRPKSAQYMNSLLAHRELKALGARAGDEGLMLTPDGRLSEGVVSNVFLVNGDAIATPSPAARILTGITRNKVTELAGPLGVETAEKDLRVDELLQAEAVFTTNSARGITPVREVLDSHGKTIWQNDSAAHPAVKKLLVAYAGLRSRRRA